MNAVILIVDDDTGVRNMLKRSLSREGYEVHVEHQSKTPLPGGATKQGR